MIQSNIIENSYRHGAKKIIVPRFIMHLSETGASTIKGRVFAHWLLEPTNEPYAIAKIAGIKMCDAYRSQYGCNFISVMPTNLYGPNDNYDLKSSHVLPALIRKFHEAKIIIT
jgi:GDP-L-fucose synthase